MKNTHTHTPHGIALSTPLSAEQYEYERLCCGVVFVLVGLKNRRGHWLCWMSTGIYSSSRKNTLINSDRLMMLLGTFTYVRTAWARLQQTPNLGKPEILIGAPSSNNLEHRLLYRI